MPPDYDAADEAFKEASQKKYQSRSLLEYWSLTRLKRGDITGLLKITGPFLAPNLSGVALLYRLAGFYRLATTREKQKDFPTALRDYQRLMTEAVDAIRLDRTEPVNAYVVRLACAVADYMIEVAFKSYRRESIDRILELALITSQDGFPPLQTLSSVLKEVITQSRRGSTSSALRKRCDQCFRLGRHLSKLLGTQNALVRDTFKVARELQTMSS
jgi:hypothetical protein